MSKTNDHTLADVEGLTASMEADRVMHSARIPSGATLNEAIDWRRRCVERALQSDVDSLDHEYLDGKAVDEDEFYGDRVDENTTRPGDCFARCIAFTLGEDPSTSSVPRPRAIDVETGDKISETRLSVEYYTKIGKWLHRSGYHAICIPLLTDDGWTSLHWDIESDCHPLVIVGGPREGDNLGHCVVWAGIPGQPGSVLIYNPSDSKLETVEDLTFLVQIWPRLE